MTVIYPVIMAGGTGTRLWPLSRQARPKQFQPIVSERPMLTETLTRLTAVEGVEMRAPIIVCGKDHAELAAASFEGLEISAGQLVLEPFGRNTAPCAIIASLLVEEEEPEALVLLLPADHHITDQKGFSQAIQHAAKTAAEGYLTALGIAPDRPETGYGYIRHGEKLDPHACKVDRFVEKPDLPMAEQYLADGQYSWNAGIFLFPARLLLGEADAYAAEMTGACRKALDTSRRDGQTVHLDPETFADVPSDSIDYALMEQTSRAALVGPVSMGWNDIGSWHAVRELADSVAPDTENVIVKNCRRTFVKTDGPTVATVGLDNVIVVATDDAVLVIDADQAQDVKAIIEELKAKGRTDLL